MAPDEAVAMRELPAFIDRSLDVLSPKEKKILQLRFGLNDPHGNGDGCTLARIAGMYGVTLQRIRQIERKALRRLRIRWRGVSEIREYAK